jgi:predicted transcriptional regulator
LEAEALAPHGISLEEMLSEQDDTFAVTLLKLIDVKGITDVECYKKANVSKQTWYKIINERSYKPSKNTVIAFAIALELTLEETKHLLATVGFALSKSNKFDIIIEYFLIKGEYNIFTINETLFKFDQVCLGV